MIGQAAGLRSGRWYKLSGNRRVVGQLECAFTDARWPRNKPNLLLI